MNVSKRSSHDAFVNSHPLRRLELSMKRKSKLFRMTVDSEFGDFDDLIADQHRVA